MRVYGYYILDREIIIATRKSFYSVSELCLTPEDQEKEEEDYPFERMTRESVLLTLIRGAMKKEELRENFNVTNNITNFIKNNKKHGVISVYDTTFRRAIDYHCD